MKQVIIITGGAGGMGVATAQLLGKDHHIILSDVNQQHLDAAKQTLAADGVSCETVVCDITDMQAVEDLFTVAKKHGQIRSVIHTAGVSPSMTDAEQIMQINALGTVNIAQAADAVADEGFSLINVASMAGYMLPRLLVPTRSFRRAHADQQTFLRKLLKPTKLFPTAQRPGIAYAISKTFVIWYSKAIARNFGQSGARVVSVSPGSFDTAMGRLEKDVGAEKMLEHAAIKRFGEPNEIAEVIAFCASDKASYLTGADILCDGGVIAGLKNKKDT